MNLVDPIYRQAELQPDAPALVSGPLLISYRDLRDGTEACARQLSARGVAQGDVVLVSMGTYPLHLFVLLALARLGAISAPVNARLPLAQRQELVQRLGAVRLVHGPEAGATLVPEMRLPAIAAGRDLLAPLHGVNLPEVDLHAAACRIELSSGTTGTPKAMLYTHAQSVRSVALKSGAVPHGPGTRMMLYMDINTAVGWSEVLVQLDSGGCVALPVNARPEAFVHEVQQNKVTTMLTTPATASLLVRTIAATPGRQAADGPSCPQLAYFAMAGGAVTPVLQQQIRELITPNLYVRYGSTESGLLAMGTPLTLARWPDSTGVCAAWVEAQTVDDDDQPLPAGTDGRLRYRGSDFCDAYVGDPQASQRTFRDGWYYPGDAGRVMPGGVIFLTGRKDDQINLGGVKVNPQTVENLLLACPGVREAAVYAVDNPASGDRVLLAAVVSATPIDEAALRRTCMESLDARSTPVKFLQVKALPRNAAGKLMRDALARHTWMEPQRAAPKGP